MPRIDKGGTDAAAPTACETPAASSGARAPCAAHAEDTHLFSDLLIGRRDGEREGTEAWQEPQERATCEEPAEVHDDPGRPVAHDPSSRQGADTEAARILRASSHSPLSHSPLSHSPLSQAPLSQGSGPAPVPPPSSGRLPGPAERPIREQTSTDGARPGARSPEQGQRPPQRRLHDLPAGPAQDLRPDPPRAALRDPAGDAERLVESGGGPYPQPAAPQAYGAPSQVGPAPSASDTADPELIAALAERILVAESKGGQDEVRLRLNIDTLQGAEITLRRRDGHLSVGLETPSPEIAQRLAAAREDLGERLRERTGLEMTIEIAQQDDTQNGDSRDGRSRNRFDYQPGAGDDA